MSAPGATAADTSAATPWFRCEPCRALIYGRRLEQSLGVCPECGHHARVPALQRLAQMFDHGSGTPLAVAAVDDDPLGFADTVPYARRLADARAATGLPEAALAAHGTVAGRPVVVVVMDFRFLGGSLGVGVGEVITTAAAHALRTRVPLVVVTSSGGARMQEGPLALMQMARTSQAFAELDEAGVPTVTVVTDPTYGGVAASFASLSDVVLVEPGARFGFAGPRVIRQTIREELPAGFQDSDFLMAHGMADAIVNRAALRETLARLGAVIVPDATSATARVDAGGDGPTDAGTEAWVRDPDTLPDRPAMDVVRLARYTDRPTVDDYVSGLVTDFQELRGDRVGADSTAVLGGLGRVGGVPVVVIGHRKGHSTRELVENGFGMAGPEGYRKAVRLMRLADKLGLPVVTLVDTPGAYPGARAEENGQAMVIAESQRLMAQLRVPVITVLTGEGGSGGALAIAVADIVLINANAWYSVISPEGCASILWRDAGRAADAAEALRLDARELLRLGVVDGVVPEPVGGAHTDPGETVRRVGLAVHRALAELADIDADGIVAHRRDRFRRFGAAQTGGAR